MLPPGGFSVWYTEAALTDRHAPGRGRQSDDQARLRVTRSEYADATQTF